MVALPRGTVTFLLTDVEASTRRWAEDRAAMDVAVAALDDVLARSVAECAGVLLKSRGEGDSAFAVFARPSDAVAAAVQVVASAPIPVRIGIHTGQAEPRDGDYFGPAPSRCARLRDLAHGGQILVSGVSASLCADDPVPEISFRDLGRVRLRDLAVDERAWQVLHAAIPHDFPPLHSRPGNVQLPLSSFVGRIDELATVAALTQKHRVVTLTGPGGCGKSRLALEVASGAPADDGVWLVDLAPTSARELVPSIVAGTLGLREGPAGGVTDALVAYLSGRRVLLVLDNCEHLVDECAAVVERLSAECPEARVLVTSREPLGVAGETVWRVPPMREDDAVALFRERAARPVSDDDGDAVSEICARLDGIPLALELAAARTGVLTPPEILDGLHDRFTLLTGGSRGAVSRQRTLEASVEWSYALLSEDAQMLLRSLSVFAGGFTRDAACRLWGGEVLDLLEVLVGKSLVVAEPSRRFRLLDTIRHYALLKAGDAGETADLRRRHFEWALALVRPDASVDDRHTSALLLPVLDEIENTVAAFDWAIEHAPGDALRLAAAAWPGWLDGGVGSGGIARLRAALAATGEGSDALRCEAEIGVAMLGWILSDADALSTVEDAQGLADSAGRTDLLAWVRALQGMRSFFVDSDPAETARLCVNAAELARSSGATGALVRALSFLGASLSYYGDARQGWPPLDEAVEVAASTGDTFLAAAKIWAAACAHILGDLRRAWTLEDEALRSSSGTVNVLSGMNTLAWACLELGRLDEARPMLVEVMRRAPLEAPVLVAMPLYNLGRLEMWEGNLCRAEELLLEAAERARTSWHIADGIQAACDLATLALVRGAADAARRHADDAVTLARRQPCGWALVLALQIRGHVALADGELERAELVLQEALEVAVRVGARLRGIDALETLAIVRHARGDDASAGRLLASAAAMRSSFAYAVAPTVQDELDALHAALGPLGAEPIVDFDELVAYALRGRGKRGGRPSTGWDALTPAELDVVRLTARGLTNPQIGDRMFISRRTVQNHLGKVFVKLGVRTRAELAAEAVRRGL